MSHLEPIIFYRMEKPIEIYKKLCGIPLVTGGWIFSKNQSLATIDSLWQQRDLTRNDTIKFQRKYMVSVEAAAILSVYPPDETNEIQKVYTNDGSRMAVFRKGMLVKRSGSAIPSQVCEFLDIYNCSSGGKQFSYNLRISEKHGKIHAKLGKCQWSPDGQRLTYVAEKYTKRVGYSDPRYTSAEYAAANDEFLERENFGEQMADVCDPVIVIFNVDTGSVSTMNNILEAYCPTEPRWLPDGSGIVFVGIMSKPSKLGRLYCFNRKSVLAVYNIASEEITILKQGYAFGSPRFAPDASKLIYLECDVGGPHAKSVRLMAREWKSQTDHILLNNVIQTVSDDDFPGLYWPLIPERCWNKSGSCLFMTSVWGSKMVMMRVEIKDGSVSMLKYIDKDTVDHSWRLLDVNDSMLLCVGSSPNVPPYLALVHMEEENGSKFEKWILFRNDHELTDKFEWKVLRFHRSAYPDESKDDESMDYEAIYCVPKEKGNHPLLLWPHGGPHSTYLTSYDRLPALFCMLGFAVLRVNYRGSIGRGDKFLNSILGRVGELDVLDCMHACSTVCKLDSQVDASRVAIFAGSYGGFVALHLIGQFVDAFRACVALSPIVNIAAMYDCSDIPDVCMVEALNEEYKIGQLLDNARRTKMWEMSPIRYASKVKTPTLILLGTEDLRAPPSQSREFINVLKGNDVPIRVQRYSGNCHPLNAVDAECDFVLNAVAWLIHNMEKNVGDKSVETT